MIELKQFIKRENLLCMIRITKINSLLREIPNKIVFWVDSIQKKNDKTFGKLL